MDIVVCRVNCLIKGVVKCLVEVGIKSGDVWVFVYLVGMVVKVVDVICFEFCVIIEEV